MARIIARARGSAPGTFSLAGTYILVMTWLCFHGLGHRLFKPGFGCCSAWRWPLHDFSLGACPMQWQTSHSQAQHLAVQAKRACRRPHSRRRSWRRLFSVSVQQKRAKYSLEGCCWWPKCFAPGWLGSSRPATPSAISRRSLGVGTSSWQHALCSSAAHAWAAQTPHITHHRTQADTIGGAGNLWRCFWP